MNMRQKAQGKRGGASNALRRQLAWAILLVLLCAPFGSVHGEEEAGCRLISQTVRPEAAEYVHALVNRRVEEDLAEGTYLKQGLSLVFLFEGAGRLEDPQQRLFGLCLVVRLDEEGNPRIVYENNESTSIPDHPKKAYDTVDCATVMDGLYDLYTDNRLDSGVLSLEKRGRIQVLRFNGLMKKGNKGYLDQATDIQIHYRKEEWNTVEATTKPFSRGCLMIGIGMEEFCAFMNSVLDTHCFVTENYPYFTLGVDKNMLAGQLILDRTLARDYLVSIYGEIGAEKILNGGKAEE